MKILGISAGRRNGTNDSMCRTALKAAKELGAEVEFINMHDLELRNCTGCLACVTSLFSGNGNICSIKDDYLWLQEKIIDADGIIWAIPIFEKCAAGVFHTFMDRFGPRSEYVHNVIAYNMYKEGKGKPIDERMIRRRCVSYMGIGGSDWGTTVLNDFYTQSLTQKWKVIDNEWFSWSQDAFDTPEKVERAAQIGRNMYEACAAGFENASWQGEPGVCPHCHGRSFYIHPNKTVVCGNCGIVGTLIEGENDYTFKFPEEQLELAHDTVSGGWKHSEEVGANNAKVMELARNAEYKARVRALAEEFPAIKPDAFCQDYKVQ